MDITIKIHIPEEKITELLAEENITREQFTADVAETLQMGANDIPGATVQTEFQ